MWLYIIVMQCSLCECTDTASCVIVGSPKALGTQPGRKSLQHHATTPPHAPIAFVMCVVIQLGQLTQSQIEVKCHPLYMTDACAFYAGPGGT